MANITATYWGVILYGTQFDDTITAYGGQNVIHAEAGSDLVLGGMHGDLIYGGGGDDKLHGGSGADTLLGGSGYDKVYGGDGADYLYGGDTWDDLVGGLGGDNMFGGAGEDYFYFGPTDSGDIYEGQADVIHDFTAEDRIYLRGNYTYAGETNNPGDGQYGVWQNNGNYVFTWNPPGYDYSDGQDFQDVIVKGANPINHIIFWD